MLGRVESKQVIASNLNLVMPDKADPERDQVAAAWESAGGVVTRLGRFWEPPDLRREAVRVYANDTFALVLAQKLGLTLVSPPDDLLVHLPQEWLLRHVRIMTFDQTATLSYPCFVKPVVPKQFRAATYQAHSDLVEECKGLEAQTQFYVSEVVEFSAEARAFLLDGAPQDIALYEGDAPLAGARTLACKVAASQHVPVTCVLDLGYISGRGWAVIEANATWGAGLNGCNPNNVIGCIAKASSAAA
jgi:hypothetical protein